MKNLYVEQKLLEQFHQRNMFNLIELLSVTAMQFALLHDQDGNRTSSDNTGRGEMFSKISRIVERNAHNIKRILKLIEVDEAHEVIDAKNVQRVIDALARMMLEVFSLADLLPHLVALCQINGQTDGIEDGPQTGYSLLENYKSAASAALIKSADQLKQDFIEVKELFEGEDLPFSNEYLAQMENLDISQDTGARL